MKLGKIKPYLSIISFIASIIVGFIALFLPPTGVIDASVLWFTAQLLCFTAGILGINLNIDSLKQKISTSNEKTKITDNFTWYELLHSNTAEELSIDNTPPIDAKAYLVELCIRILQPIRNKYGKPITVTSGYRCNKLNKAVGGAKTGTFVKSKNATWDLTSSADIPDGWTVITE